MKNERAGRLGLSSVKKMNHGKIFFLMLSGCLMVTLLSVPNAFAASSVNVPLDHWSYGAIDKLVGFGLICSEVKGTRPYTRLEMGRLANEALVESQRQADKIPSLAKHLLARFEKEFKEELAYYGWGDSHFPNTFIKPVDRVQARYVYLDGERRKFAGYPKSNAGINATEGSPLVYNNEGVYYGQHHNFTFQFSSSLRYKNVFSAYIEPIFLVRQNEGDIDDFKNAKAELLKGYGKLSPWNVELEFGRDSMWWGQGHHGDILLTNNAKPLDLVKLSNPNPTLLPWYFRYLGPFKYTIFFSRLEEDRFVPHAWLGGWRMNFKPFPIFEFGLGTTFQFAGEGRPGLTWKDIGAMLGFQFGQTAENEINQLGGIDMRLRLPFLCNIELYGEYMGNDTGTEYPEELGIGDIAYLVGIYIPRLTADGRTDLLVEYANNAHRVDDTPSFWYGHGRYRSGYTHHGLIMGHHMDGDASSLFARMTRYLSDDLVLGTDFDYIERGKTLSPIQEENYRWGGDLTYDWKDWITFQARYGYGRVKNFNLKKDDDRDNHLFMTTVKFEF